jgi:hypothetical protein
MANGKIPWANGELVEWSKRLAMPKRQPGLTGPLMHADKAKAQ